MKIRVVYSLWGADDGGDSPRVFEGGDHDVEAPAPALVGSIAGAEAAGIVEVVEATDAERRQLDAHVQSQADGEKAYAEAQANGRWTHGNLSDFVAQRRLLLARADGDEQASIRAELDQAEARLAAADVPT